MGSVMSDDDSRTETEDSKLHLPVLRPTTRADCLPGGFNAQRPCPTSDCQWHLDHTEASCVLDVADLGGVTLEEVGEYLGLTRERIRQVEAIAIRKIQHRLGQLRCWRPN